MVREILSGRDRGARRTAVVLNAAAALVVAGVAKDFSDAVLKAGAAIDDGAAIGVLEDLVQESRKSVEA